MKKISFSFLLFFISSRIFSQGTHIEIIPQPSSDWFVGQKPGGQGIRGKSGKVIIPARYEQIKKIRNGFAPFKSNGKWGLLNDSNQVVIPAEYTYMGYPKNGFVVAATGEYDNINAGILDFAGNWMAEPVHSFIQLLPNGEYIHSDPEKYLFGVKKISGEEVIPLNYSFISHEKENRRVVAYNKFYFPSAQNVADPERPDFYHGGKWGAVDESGKLIIHLKYNYLSDFSEGLAAFNKGGRWEKIGWEGFYKISGGEWGFTDRNGKEVIPAKYEYASKFENGFARVVLDNRVFYIDHSGKEIKEYVAPVAEEKPDTSEIFCEPHSWRYYNHSGEVMIEQGFTFAQPFSEGVAVVQKQEPCFPIQNYGDKEGEIFYPPPPPSPYSDYEYTYSYPKRFSILSENGYVTAATFLAQETGQCHEGLISYSVNGKWGFVDKTGRTVIRPVFHSTLYEGYPPAFSEGVCFVSDSGKWKLIDKAGRVKMVLDYDYCYPFENGIAIVRKNEKFGAINKNGKEVVPVKFESLHGFREGDSVARGSEDGDECADDCLYGFVSLNGAWVMKPRYDYIDDFSEGLAMITTKDDKIGYIDKTGKVVIPAVYFSGGSFHGGKAAVSKDGESFFIDKKGKRSTPPAKRKLVEFMNEKNLAGLRDEAGEVIVEPVFRDIIQND